MNYSTYQTAIFDWGQNGRGHAFVEAVAGSGKTTTLVELATRLKGTALFLAFNRHIRDELASRLANTSVEVMTVHQAGFRALRSNFPKTNVDARKYRSIIDDLMKDAKEGFADGFDLKSEAIDELVENYPRQAIEQVFNLARLTRTELKTREEVRAIAWGYGIELAPALYSFTAWVYQQATRIGRMEAGRVIDFTDQLVLPISMRENVQWKKYSWVLVDEAQDLSAAQLEVAMASLAPGGRMIFVGDRFQAIYQFAGADAKSIENIITRTGATILPLSICYRCPTTVLDLARKVMPTIEAAPGAPAGAVTLLKEKDDLVTRLGEGDLILCRTTAPLVSLCFRLIREKISARVRGREIGQGLIAIIEKYEKFINRGAKYRKSKDEDFAPFPDWVEAWRGAETGKVLNQNGHEEDDPAIMAINDRAQCLKEIWNNIEAPDVQKCKAYINDLFSDERSSVWLSTIHRAKGLEADRVAIIEPGLIPHPMAKAADAKQQEYHLKYVAITRAKKELILVGDADKFLGAEKADESVKNVMALHEGETPELAGLPEEDKQGWDDNVNGAR